MEKREPSALLMVSETGAVTVENTMEVSHELKTELLRDPTIPLLGIYPEKMQTLIQKNTRTQTFTAVLLTIAKI